MTQADITFIGHYGMSLLMDVNRFAVPGETMEGTSLATEPGGKGYNQAVAAAYETSAMLHEGAVKSSIVERMSGYAKHILDNYETHPGEVLIVFSNSGINSLLIEMALEAKAKGLVVVAITSMAYQHEKSRHSSGKKLFEVADYVIDTKIPKGDGLVEIAEGKVIAPGSTAVCTAIVNMLICEVAECYLEAGISPPFFISGNVEGGMEQNQAYVEEYRYRVKSL